MHPRTLRRPGAAAVALLLAGCADGGVLEPAFSRVSPLFNLTAAALPSVYLSEIHYDNASTDTGEALEIEGPAGTSLSGWSVVLYNGSNGSSYNTRQLTVSIPATCGERGVVVLEYPSNGIQNGAPDGVALVDATGAVVEFLSYEGVFTAANGPAQGMTSTDIGVGQSGSTSGDALQRDGSGSWARVSPASFGACNGDGNPPPPPPPARDDIAVTELMGGPLAAPGGASWGEWFEVHNRSDQPVDLQGWTIASAGQPVHTIDRSVLVPAGGYALLGRGWDPARNGGVTLDYNYFTGGSTIYLDNADWLTLTDAAGAPADSVAWSRMVVGASYKLTDPALDNTDVDGTAWAVSTRPFGAGDLGTPGAPNGDADGARPLPGVPTRLSLNTSGERQLPVGYQKPLFYSFTDGYGEDADLPAGSSVQWSSDTPQTATVDAAGYSTGVAAGEAVLRAEVGEVQGSIALTIIPAEAPTSARYEDHLSFGTPADATPADDVLIRKDQFALSYNALRGGPNWVSWNLNATQFGAAERCNCFTPDGDLPAGVYRVTDRDYRGSGYDRGHMVQSENRTDTDQENAVTFLLTNILPQASNTNSGPWLRLENALNDSARVAGREVYVVAGGEYSAAPETLKGEGRVAVPEWVWKVAVVVDGGEGVADVASAGEVRVIAARMPNDTVGARFIRRHAWEQYATTVDEIEERTGYDVLAALPNHIEWLVEAGLGSEAELTRDGLIATLRTGLQDMERRGELRASEARRLEQRLDELGGHLAKGQALPAANQLKGFVAQVRAMVQAGSLSHTEGGALITFAGWIEQRIG